MSSSSSSSSDQDSSGEEESSDNDSVENSSEENDSISEKEVDEDRNIEITTLLPAGATPAWRADFPPIPIGDTPWIWEPEPPLNAIQIMID